MRLQLVPSLVSASMFGARNDLAHNGWWGWIKGKQVTFPLSGQKKPTAHFWGLWQTMPHSKAEIWGQSPALANHRTQGEGPSLMFAPKIWVLPQNLHPKLGRGDPNLAQRLGRPMKRPFFDPPKNSDLKGDLFSTFLENFKNPKNSELAERAASQVQTPFRLPSQ